MPYKAPAADWSRSLHYKKGTYYPSCPLTLTESKNMSSSPVPDTRSAYGFWNPPSDNHSGTDTPRPETEVSPPHPYFHRDKCNYWTDDNISDGNQEMPPV